MIEDNTTWYLGIVEYNRSYKLAKYTDTTGATLTSSTTTAKVGLLRYGELMAGQFERYTVKGESTGTGLTTNYWTLTSDSYGCVWHIDLVGGIDSIPPSGGSCGARPSLNLKSNVQIVNGDGTKENPFQVELAS